MADEDAGLHWPIKELLDPHPASDRKANCDGNIYDLQARSAGSVQPTVAAAL